MENDEKKCPFCAEVIKAEAVKCKHCGSMLSAGPATGKPTKKGLGPLGGIVIAVLGGGALFLGYGVYVGSTPEGMARSQARAAIDQCHKDLDRWARGSREWRLIYDTCEMLDRELRSGDLSRYRSRQSGEPSLQAYPSAKGAKMVLQIGQQSAPLKSAAPLRDAPDITAAITRRALVGERLIVREIKDGWVQVSANPARKEWVMPELLDW
ncbi:hypothetical protein R6U49_00560 [Pseudomonas aeruginosa]|uniref:hypothetical protein n=1 Tax=Pseudomonas aeruginosa TaxID=287 RepID=UPI000997AEF1|nr:hypothetical protein [Pseudomonas aeruginosa]EKW6219064.1 hypothetical protein [Pseudomonas aeruginosa]ELK2660843.1 hypothetical protein [Pseudomonas aeruginosa]EME0454932.1 hypothetical protein [Pseudomonas aeruginosa]EME7058381.1 hypothetical protein [Pseudomonas aeruginosa]MCM8605049.1 hypothetical protein [Pseudomonas aeruginosa]